MFVRSVRLAGFLQLLAHPLALLPPMHVSAAHLQAATAHLGFAFQQCKFIEFLPSQLTDSQLRMRLTVNDEIKLSPTGMIARFVLPC